MSGTEEEGFVEKEMLARGRSSDYPLQNIFKPNGMNDAAYNRRYRLTQIQRGLVIMALLFGGIAGTIIWAEHTGFYEFQTYTSSDDKHYAPCRAELDAMGVSYKKVSCPIHGSTAPFNPLSIIPVASWITLFVAVLASLDIFWKYVPLTAIRAGDSPAMKGGWLRGNTPFFVWYRTTIGLSAVTNSITYANPNGIEYLILTPLFVGLSMFFVSFTTNHDVTAKGFAGIIGAAFVGFQYFSSDSKKSPWVSLPTFVAWFFMITVAAGLFLVEGLFSFKHYVDYTSLHEGSVKAVYGCCMGIFGMAIFQNFLARVAYWRLKGKGGNGVPSSREITDDAFFRKLKVNDGEWHESYPHGGFMAQFVIHNAFQVAIPWFIVILGIAVGASYSNSVNL